MNVEVTKQLSEGALLGNAPVTYEGVGVERLYLGIGERGDARKDGRRTMPARCGEALRLPFIVTHVPEEMYPDGIADPVNRPAVDCCSGLGQSTRPVPQRD